jgi:hypothetical protein
MRALLAVIAALAIAAPALALKDDTYVGYLNGTQVTTLGVTSLNSVPVTGVGHAAVLQALPPVGEKVRPG